MGNYCCTKFERGTGLGNKLFPWARCIIFAHRHKLPVLMPNWFQFRKGAIFQGGINYATIMGKILLYKNFENYGKYIEGINKIEVSLTHTKVNGDTLTLSLGNNNLYQFSGDKGFFEDLHDHLPLIKSKLMIDMHHDMKKWIDNIEVVPSIILNIRRGKDFKDAYVPEDFIFKGTLRTPLNWFIETLTQIREFAQDDIPALIISDGTKEDLKTILELPNVELLRSPSAITDLLVLTRAKVILGSGGSSFSAWGSFLSKAITLTIPGQSLQWFNVSKNLDEHIVTTYDCLNPDQLLLKHISIELLNN